MMSRSKLYKIIPIEILLLVGLLIFALVNFTNALTPEQKKVFESGTDHFNVDIYDGVCQVATPATNLPTDSEVYILGDSIANGAKASLQTELESAGYIVSGINTDSGRAISQDTAGSEPSGIEAVGNDAELIKNSDAIVVALGTNSGGEDLNTEIPNIIESIRGANSTIKIYWVNLFYTKGGSSGSRNSIITSLASAQNYTVIDTTTAGIELIDGVHPTTDGVATYVSTIVAGLKSNNEEAVTYSGSWDPLTLVYPGIPNESQVIENTKEYILNNHPKSPFAKNIQYVDQIFTLSKKHNVNPLLVMAIAKQENGFGQAASNATANNNYFGITSATGYPTVNDYAQFPTVEEGIDYFVEKVGRHVENPKGPYTGLTNFYEYLSIHQVGLIAYPGEYPENAPGRNATPPYLTFDRRMNVYTSWDPTRNSHKEGSPMYNPGIYFRNSISLINKVTDLSLSDVPSRGAAGLGGCTGQSRQVSSTGYSFPLAPQTKIQYGSLPCSIPSECHHDNTTAFDLSHAEAEGAAVYAITSGTIDTINEQDPGWCQSIQLAAHDGYFYWYGHVIDVSVSEGDTVAAGQEIAKVATWTEEHTCNGTSKGTHLHIDRGCVIDGVKQSGGNKNCRDPEFLPLMQAIYEGLPG